jgi:hypothetical protein
MSPTEATNLSTVSFPKIPEILEQILLNLDDVDIVVMTGVCTFWRNCVSGSEPLKRKMHKEREECDGDANPYFEELTEDSKDAIIPRAKYGGRNLWSTVREFEDEWVSSMHEGQNLRDMPDNLTEEEQEEWCDNDYWWRMHDVRAGFRGVRYPDTWPVGLRELHCDLCDYWHTDFRFENIHPLLRFLEETTVCFRGQGQHLKLDICIVSTKLAPMSC